MKWPPSLSDEAESEAYDYFDKNIRSLLRGNDGKIDTNKGGFQNNDVDAFRHAYVSGVFTQEYNENAAEFFGRANEFLPGGIYSNSVDQRSLNMDLWNNSVGRKYGLKFKDRASLAKTIHTREVLSVSQFVSLIESGNYPSYAVKTIKGIPTPVSNPDGRGTNNLG